MIKRFLNNPIITPDKVKSSREDFEVMCVFNAGATRYKGDNILLTRVAERPIPRDGYIATATLNLESGNIEPLYVNLNDPDLVFDDPRVFTYKGKIYLTSISHLRLAKDIGDSRFEIAETPTL